MRREPAIVPVSRNGKATIPEPLWEKSGIEPPEEVFVYEDEGRIVFEPVPSFEELGGIHSDRDRERGTVLERVRELKTKECEEKPDCDSHRYR